MRFALVTVFVLLIAEVAFTLPTSTCEGACSEIQTVLLIVGVALASPAKSSVTSTCARACPQIYDPICGKAKNGSRERLLTFGNNCVMSNYNCEHADDQFEKKSGGECGDKVSVRLQ